MFRRRRFLRRPRRRIYRRRAAKRTGVSSRVKKYVKREIHRNVENKEQIVYASNQTIACTTSSTPTGINCIPVIGGGTGSAARIGSRIKIVSGMIDMVVNLLPYNATTNPLSTPVWVSVFLVECMYGRQTLGTLGGYDWTTLFKTGGGTVGFQNSPLDLCLPINKTYWKIHKRVNFKLGAASATSTGSVGTGGYFDNSPMTKKLRLNWGKYVKNTLEFGESDNYCKNRNVMLAIQTFNADGSSTGVNVAEWHYVNYIQYEDA